MNHGDRSCWYRSVDLFSQQFSSFCNATYLAGQIVCNRLRNYSISLRWISCFHTGNDLVTYRRSSHMSLGMLREINSRCHYYYHYKQPHTLCAIVFTPVELSTLEKPTLSSSYQTISAFSPLVLRCHSGVGRAQIYWYCRRTLSLELFAAACWWSLLGFSQLKILPVSRVSKLGDWQSLIQTRLHSCNQKLSILDIHMHPPAMISFFCFRKFLLPEFTKR